MDQKKIGLFLKTLRNEKGITQEQLAEHFHVSNRTVSRWETGTNMPDISLLTEIADFYDVDVRELIEGERRNMNEAIKDVAIKMADYAGAEKGRLFKWVRVISLIGTVLMTVAIGLQCFVYEPNLFRALAIFLSFIALIAMAITTFYANGILSKLVKKRGFVIATRVIVIVLIVISVRFIIVAAVVIGLGFFEAAAPFKNLSGAENYNKDYLLSEYGADLDTGFFIFPDDTDAALEVDYNSSLKTGLFDTDGHIFLTATYSDEEFKNEIDRLSKITCTVFGSMHGDSDYHTEKILYDTEMYNYPAYISIDGYDTVYEYALIDEENKRIIYALLSYPRLTDLVKYQEYLKKDKLSYKTDDGSTLEKFSIYSFFLMTESGVNTVPRMKDVPPPGIPDNEHSASVLFW